MDDRRVPLMARLVVGVVATVALVACGSASAPTSASPASPSMSPAGPATFAQYKEWTGFTNRIGTVRAQVRYLADHGLPLADAAYADGLSELERVVAWFATHEPTDCWRSFHQHARDTTAAALPELVAIHDEARSGALDSPQTIGRLDALEAQLAELIAEERAVDCP